MPRLARLDSLASWRRSSSGCFPTRRRSEPTASLTVGGCSLLDLAGAVRHPAVRLRRRPHPRPMSRSGRRLRRRPGDLRHQGVPVSRHRPPRPRGGSAVRRRQRWRASRRARRRRACRRVRHARQQQERRRVAPGDHRRGAAHRRRQLRRARSSRRACTGRDWPCPDVLLRVTPGVHAHTHTYIATGQNDSKFGFNLANGDAERAARRAQRSPSVNLVGFHCHIGSNVFVAESFAKAAAVMAEFAAALRPPRARPRRRARRCLRRRRVGAVDERVGGRRARRLRVGRGHRRRSASSRDGPSSPARRSRCTRSARSSGSPACAPTSPSTAG